MNRFRLTLSGAIAAAALVASAAASVAVSPPAPPGPMGWTNQIGTSGADDLLAVAAGPSNGVYVSGVTDGTWPGQSAPAGTGDGLIIRLDKSGNPVWTRQFGNSGYTEIADLASSANGDVIGMGLSHDTLLGAPTAGDYDLAVVKYTSKGVLKWARMIGSTGREYAGGVAVAKSGAVYVTGYAAGPVTGATAQGPGSGNGDVLLAQYDKNGVLKWVRTFGTTADDQGMSVAVSSKEEVYVAGHTGGDITGTGHLGQEDAFVAKWDKNGTLLGSVRIADAGDEDATDIAVTPAGDVWVTGPFEGQGGYVQRYTSSLTLVWTRFFTTTEFLLNSRIVVDTKGVSYVLAKASATTPFGAGSLYLGRINKDGGIDWGIQVGSNDIDYVGGLALRSKNTDGGALVFGATTEGAIFGHSNAGIDDMFIATMSK